MAYDKSKFRRVKHGVDGRSAYCRHCKESWYDTEGEIRKAIYHAKTKGHTVDIYREHWVEYTSFTKLPPPVLNNKMKSIIGGRGDIITNIK